MELLSTQLKSALIVFISQVEQERLSTDKNRKREPNNDIELVSGADILRSSDVENSSEDKVKDDRSIFTVTFAYLFSLFFIFVCFRRKRKRKRNGNCKTLRSSGNQNGLIG